MNIEAIETLLSAESDSLVLTVESDSTLLRALSISFPEASSHVGYTAFDRTWARTFGRQILRAVNHLQDVQSWNFAEVTAVGVAVGSVAADLVRFLGLPEASTLSASALVLLIARSLAKEPKQP